MTILVQYHAYYWPPPWIPLANLFRSDKKDACLAKLFIIKLLYLNDMNVSLKQSHWFAIWKKNCASFTPRGVNNARSKQNKMADVKCFEMSIKSILNGFLLRMSTLRSSDDKMISCVCERQLFLSISVNAGRIFTSISKNLPQCILSNIG